MTKHSPDSNEGRHLPLDQRVSRLTESLAGRAVGRSPSREQAGSGAEQLEVSEDAVERLIRVRRERTRYLPVGLFGEPVWDMLLSVFHAELTQRRLSPCEVALASGFPESNGHRWLDAMLSRGWVERTSDGGAEFITLEPAIGSALRLYFREVVQKR